MKLKKYIFASAGVLAGLSLLIRAGIRANYLNQKKESQSVFLENVPIYNEANKEKDENAVKDALKGILETKVLESAKDEREYDEYTPVDGTYSLGKSEGKYYLIDVDTRKSIELEDVSLAQVSYVKDEDDSTEYNAVFIQKDGGWYVISSSAKVLAKLDDNIEVLPKSKFLVRDNKVVLLTD